MAIREVDLVNAVDHGVVPTKKNLISIHFEIESWEDPDTGEVTQEPVCTAFYNVPQGSADPHHVKKRVSDMMTAAQRKSLIDKVVE